jgi:hypothetical protein
MAFALEPSDEDFLATAPQRYSYSMDLPAPPEKVWAVLAGDEPMDFVRGLKIRWTSPAPRGIGATRRANGAFGAIRLDERYFIWDDGKRTAFTVESSNVPFFRRFAEDYIVEPTAGGCRFTWVFAVEPRLPRPIAAANGSVQRGMFGQMARDLGKHFGG